MPPKQHNKIRLKGMGAKSILGLVVALLTLFLVLSSVLGLWTKYRAIRAHIKELRLQKSELMKKKAGISVTNEYISTEEGKEEVFRNTYRLVKPGEGMVIITQDEQESEQDYQKKPAIARFWDNIKKGLGLK